jgi:hypothetical protein
MIVMTYSEIQSRVFAHLIPDIHQTPVVHKPRSRWRLWRAHPSDPFRPEPAAERGDHITNNQPR